MSSGTDYKMDRGSSFKAVNPDTTMPLVVPLDRAVKADNGKPPLSMVPRCAIEYAARAFEFGAKKYAKNNFKKGMEWSRPADAALRHLTAFMDKEDTDPESGLSHLAHLAASVAMLIYHYEKKVGTDDR